VSHPAARFGVSVEPASPRGVVRPFSVLSASEVAAYWILRALLRPWILTDPGPWSLPSPTAPRDVSNAQHIHSWVFTLLQGMAGANPSTGRPDTRGASDPMLSLSWGFAPFSGRQLERSGQPGDFHITGTLRPQGSSPSRRLAPSRAFQRLLAGPLLGLQPSGPSSCRQVRRPFGTVPSLPDVTHPDRRTLAVTSDRTRFHDEGISPRERSG